MVIELKTRATPVLDVSEVLHFKKIFITEVITSFAGTNNDLDLSWTSSGIEGNGKTVTFILPAAASFALSVVEDGSNNANITLASDAARTTTQAAGGGSDDFTVTDEGNNVWRFTHNGDWTLNTVVIGDVVNISGFDADNNGTFRVAAVNDTNDTVDIASTTGLAESTISGTISVYPLIDASNTGTLVGAAIDALPSWTSINSAGNDGTGFITTATPDFTIAGADSNEIVYTFARKQKSNTVPTVDGVIIIKPGTKYSLRNITSILYIRLSTDGIGSSDVNDFPVFVNDSIVFYSDFYNVLHANGITGALTELEK